jgi:protein-disulfide isomerase
LTGPGGASYPGWMIARPTTTALLSLALLASAACSRARSAAPAAEGGDPQAVVARIDGHAITQKEVDARAESSLQRLKDEEYEARRSALDEMITERLMDAQAQAQGVSRDELLRREVDGKVAPPTRAEVKDLYDRNKDRVGGRSLAELTPEIERSILQQRSVERGQAYLAELRSKAKISVALPQPRNEVPIPAEARILGPEKAPVTIVEFSDYLCPYCQKAQTVVDEVLARNEGKVRFVHRDFLLGRPRSMAVARAAQCAADQGKFWDYRRNLLEAPGDWSDDDLLRRTASLGLDRSLLQTCLSSDRHDKAILDSSRDGTKLGVESTPTFFINGRRMRGARDAATFQEIIDSELKAGG